MKKRNTHCWLAALVIACGLASGLSAQEEEDKPLRPEDLLGGGAGQDPQERMKEVFFEVEANLYKLSEDLAEAGAGGLFEESGDSGIQKLLDQVSKSGDAATKGIDEILELAQQMGQNQSSSSGQGQSEPQPGGESPLDKQRSNGSSGQEQTPEGPRPEGQQPAQDQQGQNKPKPDEQGQQPGEEKPGSENEQPQDGGENPEGGENKEGQNKDPKNGDPANNPRDDESWGDLPPRTQAVFRNQGGEDLPIQYRDWIDSYYRRLNKTD